MHGSRGNIQIIIVPSLVFAASIISFLSSIPFFWKGLSTLPIDGHGETVFPSFFTVHGPQIVFYVLSLLILVVCLVGFPLLSFLVRRSRQLVHFSDRSLRPDSKSRANKNKPRTKLPHHYFRDTSKFLSSLTFFADSRALRHSQGLLALSDSMFKFICSERYPNNPSLRISYAVFLHDYIRRMKPQKRTPQQRQQSNLNFLSLVKNEGLWKPSERSLKKKEDFDLSILANPDWLNFDRTDATTIVTNSNHKNLNKESQIVHIQTAIRQLIIASRANPILTDRWLAYKAIQDWSVEIAATLEQQKQMSAILPHFYHATESTVSLEIDPFVSSSHSILNSSLNLIESTVGAIESGLIDVIQQLSNRCVDATLLHTRTMKVSELIRYEMYGVCCVLISVAKDRRGGTWRRRAKAVTEQSEQIQRKVESAEWKLRSLERIINAISLCEEGIGYRTLSERQKKRASDQELDTTVLQQKLKSIQTGKPLHVHHDKQLETKLKDSTSTSLRIDTILDQIDEIEQCEAMVDLWIDEKRAMMKELAVKPKHTPLAERIKLTQSGQSPRMTEEERLQRLDLMESREEELLVSLERNEQRLNRRLKNVAKEFADRYGFLCVNEKLTDAALTSFIGGSLLREQDGRSSLWKQKKRKDNGARSTHHFRKAKGRREDDGEDDANPDSPPFSFGDRTTKSGASEFHVARDERNERLSDLSSVSGKLYHWSDCVKVNFFILFALILSLGLVMFFYCILFFDRNDARVDQIEATTIIVNNLLKMTNAMKEFVWMDDFGNTTSLDWHAQNTKISLSEIKRTVEESNRIINEYIKVLSIQDQKNKGSTIGTASSIAIALFQTSSITSTSNTATHSLHSSPNQIPKKTDYPMLLFTKTLSVHDALMTFSSIMEDAIDNAIYNTRASVADQALPYANILTVVLNTPTFISEIVKRELSDMLKSEALDVTVSIVSFIVASFVVLILYVVIWIYQHYRLAKLLKIEQRQSVECLCYALTAEDALTVSRQHHDKQHFEQLVEEHHQRGMQKYQRQRRRSRQYDFDANDNFRHFDDLRQSDSMSSFSQSDISISSVSDTSLSAASEDSEEAAMKHRNTKKPSPLSTVDQSHQVNQQQEQDAAWINQNSPSSDTPLPDPSRHVDLKRPVTIRTASHIDSLYSDTITPRGPPQNSIHTDRSEIEQHADMVPLTSGRDQPAKQFETPDLSQNDSDSFRSSRSLVRPNAPPANSRPVSPVWETSRMFNMPVLPLATRYHLPVTLTGMFTVLLIVFAVIWMLMTFSSFSMDSPMSMIRPVNLIDPSATNTTAYSAAHNDPRGLYSLSLSSQLFVTGQRLVSVNLVKLLAMQYALRQHFTILNIDDYADEEWSVCSRGGICTTPVFMQIPNATSSPALGTNPYCHLVPVAGSHEDVEVVFSRSIALAAQLHTISRFGNIDAFRKSSYQTRSNTEWGAEITRPVSHFVTPDAALRTSSSTELPLTGDENIDSFLVDSIRRLFTSLVIEADSDGGDPVASLISTMQVLIGMDCSDDAECWAEPPFLSFYNGSYAHLCSQLESHFDKLYEHSRDATHVKQYANLTVMLVSFFVIVVLSLVGLVWIMAVVRRFGIENESVRMIEGIVFSAKPRMARKDKLRKKTIEKYNKKKADRAERHLRAASTSPDSFGSTLSPRSPYEIGRKPPVRRRSSQLLPMMDTAIHEVEEENWHESPEKRSDREQWSFEDEEENLPEDRMGLIGIDSDDSDEWEESGG
ncbi:hypothetical protein BLNAU_15510 [Blattamonas nauphoetae]|uniref:Uncharacterized protein n=1 Tax=Blattamonas nauphoetae TaxID=2049346 RepID=A0ABQ9XAN1_9EUKA|nr:hypothetical protein BLNAU_15510 [Blattamonas nauphoetae]